MSRHGWARRGWLGLLLPWTIILGCGEAHPHEAEEPVREADVAETCFDPGTAGAIHGRVIWEGEVPEVAPFDVRPNPLAGEVLRQRQRRPNPNAPVINVRTKGVGNAVVFLRGVDPRRGKSWDHPPLRIEQRACQFHLCQGEVDSPFGFVRCGERVEMVSRDPFFHSLHAGGAAFFSLMFPDPDQPLSRRLHEKGIVELTSAAGYYWMRAYLFVDDHPYYTRTDAEGNFLVSEVPAGTYEIVCWMPSWRKARHERDPESGVVSRIFFEPPVQVVQPLTLMSKSTPEVHFLLSGNLFTSPSTISAEGVRPAPSTSATR
jgi:hypothetical protein